VIHKFLSEPFPAFGFMSLGKNGLKIVDNIWNSKFRYRKTGKAGLRENAEGIPALRYTRLWLRDLAARDEFVADDLAWAWAHYWRWGQDFPYIMITQGTYSMSVLVSMNSRAACSPSMSTRSSHVCATLRRSWSESFDGLILVDEETVVAAIPFFSAQAVSKRHETIWVCCSCSELERDKSTNTKYQCVDSFYFSSENFIIQMKMYGFWAILEGVLTVEAILGWFFHAFLNIF
jgi:hypothetical protein